MNKEFKKCSFCEKELPLEKFPKNRSNKDGLNYQCKTCSQGKGTRPKTRQCTICGEEKAMRAFKNPITKRLSKYCKMCTSKGDSFIETMRYKQKKSADPEYKKDYWRETKRKGRENYKNAVKNSKS